MWHLLLGWHLLLLELSSTSLRTHAIEVVTPTKLIGPSLEVTTELIGALWPALERIWAFGAWNGAWGPLKIVPGGCVAEIVGHAHLVHHLSPKSLLLLLLRKALSLNLSLKATGHVWHRHRQVGHV